MTTTTKQNKNIWCIFASAFWKKLAQELKAKDTELRVLPLFKVNRSYTNGKLKLTVRS